ncbi:hypothetical protein KVR01_011963 [Diaporthe batatas]|uniref:uncharacterized protein n=1 Tax=Diaporthe batatas TaxID=748121 RepID=UPI001D0513A3|nr:uncharacterized protein KVR01_011963 [Diaporthe batatas]KAG8158202.1 hypothetical protein KVR01_011963 [Diaporthe batatas]
MSAEELLKKIHNREAVLLARAAETEAREAELQDLKDSLTRLERARDGIRDAIQGALSGNVPSPGPGPNPNTGGVAPADLIELAVKGSSSSSSGSSISGSSGGSSGSSDSNPSNPFLGEGGGVNLSAHEAVGLALIAMRDELGPKELVKFVIQTAIQSSGLDSQEVIQAALETAAGDELTVDDVVHACLGAARDAGPTSMSARAIVGPAVRTASLLGCEVPVIFKEMFYAAASILPHDPAMTRSSVLSVLGCAMGMGMTRQDLMDVMEVFSREVKHGAFGGGSGGEPPRTVGPSTPLETQDPDPLQPHHPQQSQPGADSADHADTINVALDHSADTSHLDPVNNDTQGLPAEEDILESVLFAPPSSPSYPQSINNARSSPAPAPIPAKRRAGDEEDDNSDLKEQFVAQESLLQEKIKNVDELAALTKKLEEQKLALSAKSAELQQCAGDVTGMKTRMNLLSDLAAPLDAAMKVKITADDVLQQVLEAVLRNKYLTSGEIMERTVNIAKGVGERARGDILADIIADLIDDEQGLKAAIEASMANFSSPNDVLKTTLAIALKQGAKPADLLEGVAKTAYDMLGDKAKASSTPQPAKEAPIAARCPERTPERKPERSPERNPARKPGRNQERRRWVGVLCSWQRRDQSRWRSRSLPWTRRAVWYAWQLEHHP